MHRTVSHNKKLLLSLKLKKCLEASNLTYLLSCMNYSIATVINTVVILIMIVIMVIFIEPLLCKVWLWATSLYQELVNYDPSARCDFPVILENKVLLEHSLTLSFTYGLWLS